jgi:hypothetical protein
MNIFVTEEFLSEVKIISKDKSHSNCESDLIDSIFKKNIDEIKNIGTKRLGGQPDKNPFLRKRIGSENSGKSSGYRLYFWLFIADENVFLLFIHPKTGRRSASNISTDKQKELVKTFKEYRDRDKFIEVELDETKGQIIFKKTKKLALQ